MRRLHSSIFILSAALSLVAVHASAQTPAALTWEAAKLDHFPADADIILLAEPGVLHRCNVQTVDDEGVTCSRHLRKPVAYKREDVQQIIAREWNNPRWLSTLEGLAVSGGLLTGAVYLAMLGPVGIAAAVAVGFVGAVGVMFSAFDDTGTGYSARHAVYVKAGSAAEVATK